MWLDKLKRSTKKEPIVIPVIDDNANYLTIAKKTADIVQNEVDGGELADLRIKLGAVERISGNRESFVFPGSSLLTHYSMLTIAGLFSVVFAVILLISVGTIALSSQYRLPGIIGLVASVGILVVNIRIIDREVGQIRFLKRFGKYYELLQHKNVALIEPLADYVKIPVKTVERDIYLAIDQNLIPQGHLGTENKVLMMSHAVFEKYSAAQAEYDRYYDKLLEEYHRQEERPDEVEALLELGEQYKAKIRAANDLIKDNAITEKLDQMEKMVSAIFYEVDVDPSNADKLGLLLGYYLPTTEKLLSTYIDMTEKTVQGGKIRRIRKDISDSLGIINKAFEKILDGFFEEKQIEVESDIEAMRSISD